MKGVIDLHPAAGVRLPPGNPLVEHQLVTVLPSQVLPALVVMVMMVLMRGVNEMVLGDGPPNHSTWSTMVMVNIVNVKDGDG